MPVNDNLPAGYRVGVDIGGTFTDIVLTTPDGRTLTKKVPSSTEDYARAIVAGLGALLAEHGLAPEAVAEVVHGTTVATNAILEGRGAKTALITTRGFRDVLELRRLRTPRLYDRFYQPPRPIVERRLRLEVDERLDARGEVITPLDPDSVRAAVERIRADGAEAVAVTLLHSFRNPEHERAVGRMVRAALPEVFLSLSVDVLPEIREYERTSTTVLNAYVGPTVRRYLHSLLDGLTRAGLRAPLWIMQSNGGIMSARSAAELPAHIVESGPAAGVIAAHRVGRAAGAANVMSFDMGGTTAKASLIERGEVTRTTEFEVGAGISLSSRLVKGGGHALKLPVIDIAEVGAGGGSIVWLDRSSALKVGPRSAGAVPGPACYGAGGAEPTITDANLVLGYLNPEYLAGGAVRLDADLAHRALDEQVCRPLGLDRLAAAFGVHTLANVSMIRALKAVSTYRGRDPREFDLLAFGGSGPIHAAGMARALGMRRVLVPPAPGLFSAAGLLAAEMEHHLVQTCLAPTTSVDLAALNRTFRDLEARALALASEGGPGAQFSMPSGNGGAIGTLSPEPPSTLPAARGNQHFVCRRAVDLRYVGQGYELTVPAPAGDLTAADVAALVESFGTEHERTYGHRAADEPVEIVNLRVVARADDGRRIPEPGLSAAGAAATPGAGRPCERIAYFGPDAGSLRTPVIGREQLDRTPRRGPLIVEEYDATTVVPPGCTARLDDLGNLVIEIDT